MLYLWESADAVYASAIDPDVDFEKAHDQSVVITPEWDKNNSNSRGVGIQLQVIQNILLSAGVTYKVSE